MKTLILCFMGLFSVVTGTEVFNDEIRFTHLEKKLGALVDRVETLENIVQNQNNVINLQHGRIASMENTIKIQLSNIYEQYERIKELEGNAHEMNATIEAQNECLGKVERKLKTSLMEEATDRLQNVLIYGKEKSTTNEADDINGDKSHDSKRKSSNSDDRTKQTRSKSK